jgi:alanyl-tRNA synthetase
MSATPVIASEMPYTDAIKTGALALFGEKYSECVRVVQIKNISSELCGGCHVRNSGQIGLFSILSESSIAGGVRRIEAVTGFNALQFYEQKENALRDILHKTEALLADKDKELKKVLAGSAKAEAASIAASAVEINGIKSVVAKVNDYDIDIMRQMADTIKALLGECVVFLASLHNNKPLFVAAVSDGLICEKGLKAGDLVKAAAEASGGGGGGRAQMATGGGQDGRKLPEAFETVRSLLK